VRRRPQKTEFNIKETNAVTPALISFSRKKDRLKTIRKRDVPIRMIQFTDISMQVMVILQKKRLNYKIV
jgi:hypothetical protein